MSNARAVHVVLLGLGGVGRALLRLLVASRSRIVSRASARLCVVAIADSHVSGIVADRGCELSDADLLAIAETKSHCPRPARWSPPPQLSCAVTWSDVSTIDLVRAARRIHGACVVCDATATDATLGALEAALLGDSPGDCCAVLANKRPLAAARERSLPLLACPRMRHGSTVGGGDPVLSAGLRYLLDVGESPTEICGEMSGSLAFMCRRISEGARMSEAIAEAAQQGFTEPDPRDDLGGRDAARKLLILARACGDATSELCDVAVEALVTPEMAAVPGCPPVIVDVVKAAEKTLDSLLAPRVEAARAKGLVIRFVARATMEPGKRPVLRVGLEEVEASSLLSVMPRHIAFRTAGAWSRAPLVISGAGGSERTAAGMLGDIVALIREHMI